MSDHLWLKEGWPEEDPLEPLPPPKLLHLLTCPACRHWAVGRLLEEEESRSAREDAPEDRYAEVWERLEAMSPKLIREAERRREEAEILLEELRRVPGARRGKLIETDSRFRSLDMLELLLESSHASQLTHPVYSEALAGYAARLAKLFGDSEEEARASVPRAYCLGANAKRLRQNLKGAEAQLAKAAPSLTYASERAFYCRTAALVRWEEGRPEEAAALLQQTVRLYSEGPYGETGASLVLLGLLLQEEGQLSNALTVLVQGWASLDRAIRPLLSVRAGLALAACLAMAEQPERARAILSEVWRLYPEVHDAEEMLRVYWFEGNAIALLGQREEARHVLESVRRKLLAESSPAEAALVSLDLALVLAEVGQPQEIEPLAVELGQMLSAPALGLAVEALRSCAALGAAGDSRLRERTMETNASLRRYLRSLGYRLRPLQFA